MNLSVLNPGMAYDNNVSPVRTDIPSQNDKSIADRVNGMSQRLAFSPGDDPILSKVAMRTKAPRLAKSGAVGRRDRKIESIGRDG